MRTRRDWIKSAGVFGFAMALTRVVNAASAIKAQQGVTKENPPASSPEKISPVSAESARGNQMAEDASCLSKQKELTTESSESPFFQHFHQLSIPVSALLKPPAEGITVQTSAMDSGSYDVAQFKSFLQKASLDAKKFIAHSHSVFISADELARIAGGESNVEIRVTSPNGNYVHNFLVSATGSTLAKVRRYKEGKIQI